jgi:TRAP-type C4-dicarboxylate transport system permease small subunit
VATQAAQHTQQLERVGQWLARAILFCGAAILCAMLALTCVDVFGRYILNSPVNGKTELTRFAMAGLIACALPVVSVTGQHIAVDLFDHFFTRRGAAVRDFIVDLIMSGSLMIITYWIKFRADRLLRNGDYSDFLHIKLYPMAYFIAVMTAVTALALLAKAGLDFYYIRRPDLRPEPAAKLDPDRIG